MPTNLLSGTKEFYRRWLDDKPRLVDIAESASREAGTVTFKWVPFAIIAYDACIESLVRAMRPAEQLRSTEKLRQRLLRETGLSGAEVETRLAALSSLPPWEALQQIWDEMFMIDIDSTNRERFGVDFKTIIARIDSNHVP